MGKTLKSLEDRNVGNAKMQQQYIMTSANNLDLLLSEVLQAMQNQQAQQMPGNKSCSKPGQGKPSLQQARSQQEGLKSQLEQMIKQMKDGQGKDGQKFDKNAMNKRLTQMLAQQEMFNQMMNNIKNGSSLTPEMTKKLNEISQLNEQNQRDLINKNITPQLVKRQDQILTRLLEAENSDYQREVDKKRESKEIKDDNFRNLLRNFKYNRENSLFEELLNTSNLELQKYYLNKYKEYLIKLNE